MTPPERVFISDMPSVEQDPGGLTIVVPLSRAPTMLWGRAFSDACESSHAVIDTTLRLGVPEASNVETVLSKARHAIEIANDATALAGQVDVWWQAHADDPAESPGLAGEPQTPAPFHPATANGPRLTALVWLPIVAVGVILIATLFAGGPADDATSQPPPSTVAETTGISIVGFASQDGSTTSSRPTQTTTTRLTTTTTIPDFSVEINSNLPYTLGGVHLGASAQQTIAYLTRSDMLGHPKSDTGWLSPTWERGWLWCWDTFTHERIIKWDGVTLLVGRGAEELFNGPLDRVIAISTWLPESPSPTLLTPEGLTAGDTEATLLDLYPRARFADDPSYGPHYIIRGNESGLVAFLDEFRYVRLVFLGFVCGD